MALRVWSTLRFKRRSAVAVLSLVTLSAVMLSTLPPFPSETRSLPPRGLSSPGRDGLPERDAAEPRRPLPPHGHSGAWKRAAAATGAPAERPLAVVRHKRGRRAGGEHKAAVTSKRKKKPSNGGGKRTRRRHAADEGGKRVVKQGNRGDAVRSVQLPLPRHKAAGPQPAGTQSLHPDDAPCGHTCPPDGPGPESMAGEAVTAQQAVRRAFGDAGAHDRRVERSSKRKGPRPLARAKEGKASDLGGCQTLGGDGAFSNGTRAAPPPWLSADDVEKMELLSGRPVVSKARVPGHGQVLRVGLGEAGAEPPGGGGGGGGDHDRLCQRGRCALIKRPGDWFEVFAFHLDRVLGLNRSLPAALRRFHSDLLPYRYTGGSARPAVWWDPGIQHLADDDNDQNSFSLTWPQYQALLRSRCGGEVPLNATPCVGVQHSEWGRLALFDFLLQVNDRLDRYCCGFRPDPSELCIENLLHVKCRSPKDLLLVHILVRRAEPSRLVFIDNAGRPHHPHDNLNFRLVEGIDELPARAVSVLQSGCLESMLLRSLSLDQEFWESRGGASGLKPLIGTVEQRGRILLRYVQDERRLRLSRDL